MEWLEEHWALTEDGKHCQQPRAGPAAPPWVLLPAVELSSDTVQLCDHRAEWGKQPSCESCSRHSCKKSQTQGFFALTQELPGSSGLLSYFSGMPLYFTPCVGALLTRAPGDRLLPLWHCGSASDEQTAT